MQLIFSHFGDFVCAQEVGESWSSLAKADWRKLVFADKMIQRMTLSDYGIQNGVISTVSRQSELAPFQFHHASGGQLANERGGYPIGGVAAE